MEEGRIETHEKASWNLSQGIIQIINELLIEQRFHYMNGDFMTSMFVEEQIVTNIYPYLTKDEFTFCNNYKKIITHAYVNRMRYENKKERGRLTLEEEKALRHYKSKEPHMVTCYIRYIMLLLKKYGFLIKNQDDTINKTSTKYSVA